jgi:hypothetical protein
MNRHPRPSPLHPIARALLLAGGAASLALPAHAADECKVEIGYHTINNVGLRTDQTAEIAIDLGERKQVDRSRMNYVKNVKNQKVRVNLDGAAIPTPEFDLDQNQRNPLVLFYTTQVTLDWLECRPNSPNQLLEAMKAAGKSATQIAQALKDTLGQNAQQVAGALKAAGYTAAQIAAGLKGAFDASAATAAQALKAVGYTGAQVAAALKAGFDASAQTAAAALQAAFAAGGEQVTAWLAAAGYTGAQLAAAAKSAFSATAAQAAQWIRAAENAGIAQMAQWLQAAGYALGQVADALEAYNDLGGTVAALKQAFGASAEQLVAALRAAATPIGNCGPAGCDTLGRALRDAGYNATVTLAALRTGFGLTVQAAHAMLVSIFEQSATAIERTLAAAGYTAQQIAQVMGAAGDRAADAIAGGVAAGRGAIDGAAASTMTIEYMMLGIGTLDCSRYPAERFYNPVPLPPGARDWRITLRGSQALGAATAVNGWPSGTTATIEQRGPCFLIVRMNVPAGAREGTTGQAVVMAGTQPGPRLNWRVGAVPVPPRAPEVVGGKPVGVCPGRIDPVTNRCEPR